MANVERLFEGVHAALRDLSLLVQHLTVGYVGEDWKKDAAITGLVKKIVDAASALSHSVSGELWSKSFGLDVVKRTQAAMHEIAHLIDALRAALKSSSQKPKAALTDVAKSFAQFEEADKLLQNYRAEEIMESEGASFVRIVRKALEHLVLFPTALSLAFGGGAAEWQRTARLVEVVDHIQLATREISSIVEAQIAANHVTFEAFLDLKTMVNELDQYIELNTAFFEQIAAQLESRGQNFAGVWNLLNQWKRLIARSKQYEPRIRSSSGGGGGLVRSPKLGTTLTVEHGADCLRKFPVFDDSMTAIVCDFGEWFEFHKIVAAGQDGIVVQVTARKPREMGLPVNGDNSLALKLQRLTPYANFNMLAAEIAVNVALKHIESFSVVKMFFWTRWILGGLQKIMNESLLIHSEYLEFVSDAYTKYQLILMEYAHGGALHSALESAINEYVVKPPDTDLKIRVNKIVFLQGCMLAQIYAQLQNIRVVIPDFRHNDLHGANILLDDSPLIKDVGRTNCLYYYGWKDKDGNSQRLSIPLFLFGNRILKIADFGWASGSYQGSDGKAYRFGLRLKPKHRHIDHRATTKPMKELIQAVDVVAAAAYEASILGRAALSMVNREEDDSTLGETFYLRLLTENPLFDMFRGKPRQVFKSISKLTGLNLGKPLRVRIHLHSHLQDRVTIEKAII